MEVEKKRFVKIGRPGYKITKIREPLMEDESGDWGGRMGLLFQVDLPQIKEGVKPLHRFMSSFEQHVEMQNRAWQYLVVSGQAKVRITENADLAKILSFSP